MSKYIEAVKKVRGGLPLSENEKEVLENGANILKSVPEIYKAPALLAKQQKGYELSKVEKNILVCSLCFCQSRKMMKLPMKRQQMICSLKNC